MIENPDKLLQEIIALKKDIKELKQLLKPDSIGSSVVALVDHSTTSAKPNQESSAYKSAINISWILDPAKLVAWFGASVGGLSILLGIIGFLAIGAHDAMLGIPKTLQVELDYIKVGGLFFSRSMIFVITAILFNKWCWLILAIVISIFVTRFYMPRRHYQLCLMISAIGLIVVEFYLFWLLIQPLQFPNMLLQINDGSASQVLSAILGNDRIWLQHEYGFLALFAFCLAIAIKYLDKAIQAKNSAGSMQKKVFLVWRWIRIPAFLLLVVFFFYLPRVYGVLTLSNEYPQVTEINYATSSSKELNTMPFLIRDDGKSLILYDPGSHSISSLNLQSINHYRISNPRHIFGGGKGG